MRKGNMRRVSALELLQCCSAAVLRTPLPCSDQGAAAAQHSNMAGHGGGGLGGFLPIYKGRNLIEITIRYVLYQGKSQSSKTAAPTLKKKNNLQIFLSLVFKKFERIF